MLGPLYFILFVCSPPCFKNDLSWDPSHSPPQGKGGCDHPNARGLKEISEKKSSAHRYCLFIIEVTFPSKHSFIDLINPQISVEGKGHIIWLYTLPSRSFRLDWRDGVCANTMLPVWMAESGERKPFCRWTNQERLHGRGGWGSRWGFGWGAVSQAQLRAEWSGEGAYIHWKRLAKNYCKHFICIQIIEFSPGPNEERLFSSKYEP